MGVKAPGLTRRGRSILSNWRAREGSGIPGVAVKCADIRRNTSGAGAPWLASDAERQQLGERKGLETLVVLAVNAGC